MGGVLGGRESVELRVDIEVGLVSNWQDRALVEFLEHRGHKFTAGQIRVFAKLFVEFLPCLSRGAFQTSEFVGGKIWFALDGGSKAGFLDPVVHSLGDLGFVHVVEPVLVNGAFGGAALTCMDAIGTVTVFLALLVVGIWWLHDGS
jgi:hypothetical protein